MSKINWRSHKAIYSLAFAALLPTQCAAFKVPESTLATLPIYCKDSELSVHFGRRFDYWQSRLGGLFYTIHHYCSGILKFRESRKWPKDSSQYKILLRGAISEYNFILRIDPKRLQRFPLWPEMLARRGEAAVLLDDWELAAASYEQARLVKPDYWPAYLEWAEVLAGLNLKSQARALIHQGLLIDPTVESMRKALLRYGGALKDIPDKPPATASASEVAAPSASAAAPGVLGASTPL